MDKFGCWMWEFCAQNHNFVIEAIRTKKNWQARLRKVQYIFPRAQKQWGGIKFDIDHMVSPYLSVSGRKTVRLEGIILL